jgi:kynureninase
MQLYCSSKPTAEKVFATFSWRAEGRQVVYVETTNLHTKYQYVAPQTSFATAARYLPIISSPDEAMTIYAAIEFVFGLL